MSFLSIVEELYEYLFTILEFSALNDYFLCGFHIYLLFLWETLEVSMVF